MPTKAVTADITPEAFRVARHGLGLTQTELGARLGVGKMAIYNIEAGRRPVTKAAAVAVAGLLLAQAAPAGLRRIPPIWAEILAGE